MNLPKDPVMLLSVVNTKLRDQYPHPEALCEDTDLTYSELCEKLKGIGYVYNQDRNQFV